MEAAIPRDSSGVYSKPAGTTAEPNTTITSSQFNSTIDDFVSDANTPRAISVGGTGATTANAARTALDVARKQATTAEFVAGRGMIVGAGGLLGEALAAGVTNANDIITGHNWWIADTAGISNLPIDQPGVMTVTIGAASRYFQVYRVIAGSALNTGRGFTRAHTAGVWSSWREIVTVIKGSNANGEYRMYSDGTMVCTHTPAAVALNINTDIATSGVQGFRSTSQSWTYPVAFIAPPEFIAGTPIGATGGGSPIFYDGGLLAASCTYSFTSHAAVGTTDRMIRLMARGNWR